ncbi:MAG: riboflavin synthase [Candidatus Omnitrophica bacterium CG11_big_fil_rev_8_21_14_0_20_63_9]|nr:MAG: riboflavin synthase [Candidatus Omnitrophica bacterium CG11_big_fil_rev_8_21_14_0_20_63_9]
MFTGIVREIGTVAKIQRAAGLVRLTVEAPKTSPLVQPMESVAVNGVCLSATHVRGGAITFDMIGETQRLTTLGALRSGSRVHVEPSLAVTDRLSGHLLLGHVDGTGTIASRRQRAGELILNIRVSSSLRSWLVPKGPIAVDGVSLTVGAALGGSTFPVHLIPETLRRTTLGERGVGDRLNIEIDYMAKLIRQYMTASHRNGQVWRVTRSGGPRPPARSSELAVSRRAAPERGRTAGSRSGRTRQT